MTGAIVFDTLTYTKKLEAAGMSRNMAEAHAEALASVIEDRLATKDDIKDLKTELKNDIERVTYQLTIRMGSLIAGGIILLGAFNKLV